MKTFDNVQEAKEYSKKNPTETVDYKLYWYNGNLYEHYFYVNGLYHGEYKDYHSNGNLKYHYFYVNGNQHGEFKWYHSDGILGYHHFYVNGKRHGEYKSYWDNGKLDEHSFLVDGKETKLDHLRDGSYKSLCIKHTLFDGNVIHEDI